MITSGASFAGDSAAKTAGVRQKAESPKEVTGMRSFVVEPLQYGPPLPCRRRGTYCSTNRRKGHEPGFCRRHYLAEGFGRFTEKMITRSLIPTLQPASAAYGGLNGSPRG